MTAENSYDALVKRYVQLAMDREQIDTEMEQIKAELRNLELGTHKIAGVKVTLSPNRRIDQKQLTTLYPFSTHPELYTLTPDAKKVRANLPPKVVDSLMTSIGQPRVTIS